MKAKALQFGKAMSAALFVLLLSVAGMKNAFAQNQVATLQHNDTITGSFYGSEALSSASNAAVSGDIITLSSGTFNATSLNKGGLTIRGAGCMYDTLTNIQPTIISGNLAIAGGTNNISFEGIWFTGTVTSYAYPGSFGPSYPTDNISFLKCFINEVKSSNNGLVRYNWQFANCLFNFNPDAKFHGMSFINSVVRMNKYQHVDEFNLTTVHNSVVLFDEGIPVNNMIANNSVFVTDSEHNISNCIFYNCIGIKLGETLLFEGQSNQTNMVANDYTDVFETFTGTISNTNCYELNEDVATSFLGQDGTEIGIYGGMMPYNPRPSYMIIKRCNVAPRSTVDGKLSVDIEIIAEDE